MPPSSRNIPSPPTTVNERSEATKLDDVIKTAVSERQERNENPLGTLNQNREGMYNHENNTYDRGLYSNSMMGGMYGGTGIHSGGMYGGGMYGGGAISPFYGGMSSGPLSRLNQYLFGIQNFVFSLGQAVQVSNLGNHK